MDKENNNCSVSVDITARHETGKAVEADYKLATFMVEVVEVRKKTVDVLLPIGAYGEAQEKVRRMIEAGSLDMDTAECETSVNVEEIIYSDENKAK